MDDLVHRPVPGLPAGWVRLLSIARLSGPSITTYTSITKVQEQNSTIYEMDSMLHEQYSALGDLFVADRIVDLSFAVGFGMVRIGSAVSARVLASGSTVMHGESLGAALVRNGVLSGPGLRKGTEFITVAGVGAAIAGPAVRYGTEFGLHVVAEHAWKEYTTDGVRETFNETVASLNESLNSLNKELKALGQQVRSKCE